VAKTVVEESAILKSTAAIEPMAEEVSKEFKPTQSVTVPSTVIISEAKRLEMEE
jgi:hypothetical protein